ncbi:MAG: RHS repeat-associated core domain-containing protein [Bacteroidales bacterium]|nr:RHS repeat-associated core domain-containing protein [Bacteroidales bacterium]
MKDGIEKYTKHYYTGNHLSSTQLVTDGTGVVVQQVEYAPFGEVVNEYNIDWSNGQVPDFKFNGKELDEESGMYYFEARYQSPPVFISRDVMFEARPYMSPYAYCSNSPVNRVDPSGMFDWEPEVSSNGEVSYRAEKGDNKETFKSQYGLTDKQANDIVGNKSIKEGDKISSTDVKKAMGTDILRLDWSSKQATNRRKAYQMAFAILHTKITKRGEIDMNKYIKNFPSIHTELAVENFRIPLLDGGKLKALYMNSTINGKYSKIWDRGIFQFDYSDGTSRERHRFEQAGGNIPRLFIIIQSEDLEIYEKSYR